MIAQVEFSPALIDWAAQAGYGFTPASDYDPDAPDQSQYSKLMRGRAMFTSPPDLITFVDARADGWFVVSSSERMGSEGFLFATRSLAVLEKYFYGSFGWLIRNRLRLPLLQRPQALSQLAPGYRVGLMEFDGHSRNTLLDLAGEVLGVDQGGAQSGPGSMVTLSVHVAASVADIGGCQVACVGSPSNQPG